MNFATIGQNIVKLTAKYWDKFLLTGMGYTLSLAAITVAVGAILGALIAFMRMSKIAPLRWIASIYTEIIRSGILAVDIGQTEAARSLGMSHRLTMTQIILPQAIKNILPALGNEFIMIIKDTSLASTFFIGDLMTQVLVVKGATYLTIEPLIMVAVIYFALTFVLTKLLGVFERRLRRGDVR